MDFIREKKRPALLCNNVERLEIKSLKAPGASDTPELIRLVDTSDAVISPCRPA